MTHSKVNTSSELFISFIVIKKIDLSHYIFNDDLIFLFDWKYKKKKIRQYRRKKEKKTINIIQIINVHKQKKQKTLTKFECWSKNKMWLLLTTFIYHLFSSKLFDTNTSISWDTSTYLTFFFYGNIGEYHKCGAPPYDIVGIFFIWSKSRRLLLF